jgi:hypothetical protein
VKKKGAETAAASPLAGTERTFFEGRGEGLRAEYEASVQGMVDAFEASSAAVASLGRKRIRHVRFATFFGTVGLRCREGVGAGGGWTCPALRHLGLRPNQRYSPDMERRMAVLAAETGSYEKASGVVDAAAWFAASDGAVRSDVLRLGAAALEAIRGQNACFRSHAAHMDYAANAALGVSIGSGPVESLCSQFQNRLKRTGQFWTREGFAALLRIIVRNWNGELDSLWPASAA